MIFSKKSLSFLTAIIVWSSGFSAQTSSRLDSINKYLMGSWKVEVVKYFDGGRDGISRDVSFLDKTLHVHETTNGMRKLKYSGETRLDSLDDGTVVIYAYLDQTTKTSNCNTLLFHLRADADDNMTVEWFELFFLRDEEKTNFYFAKCLFTRVLD